MLRPGHIVTDIDPESVLEGEQGEVVNVQLCLWSTPEVLVRFDMDLKSKLFTIWQEEDYSDGIYEIYKERELRRNRDWKPERYAMRLFGKNWHTLQVCKRPLDPLRLCMVDKCSDHETEAVWVNIWGTVLNVYVCLDHAKHYRKYSCMDDFPFRNDPAAHPA